MKLEDAIARLLVSAEDEAVWQAVDQALTALGGRGGVVAAHRDDAVATAKLALVALLDDGGLAEIEHPTSYFYCIVRNASISLYRRERSEAKKAELAQLVGERSAFEPRLTVEAITSFIERVTPPALAARPSGRRPELEDSIKRMVTMAAQGYHTADVIEDVARHEGISLTNSQERARLVDTIDQRHTRARKYLLEAVDKMERRGDLAPEEAADAREAVRLLRRRQERRAPASGGR